MKRLIASVLAASMLIALCACGAKDESETKVDAEVENEEIKLVGDGEVADGEVNAEVETEADAEVKTEDEGSKAPSKNESKPQANSGGLKVESEGGLKVESGENIVIEGEMLEITPVEPSKPVESKPQASTPAASTVGTALQAAFKSAVSANASISAQDLADKLLANEVIKFSGAAMPVEPGVLTGFDNAETDTWKWLGWNSRDAYVNAPGWVSGNWSEWGQTRSAGIADDNGNSVMLIKDSTGGSKSASGLLYDLSAIPDVCDLNISYRMKTNFASGYFVAMFANDRYATGSKNEAFLASVGVNGDGNQGGLSISTGSRWMQDGGYNLLSAEEYTHDVWYTVEAVYHLNGVGAMTADYVIKNAEGEVVASVAGKNVASAFVKPVLFGWRLQHGASNTSAYAMIDDLSISYDIPANNVKSVRLENVEGTENVPTTTPASDMKAINVTFTAEATDVVATLADNNGNEIALTPSGSGSAYSFKLETFPKGGTEYTFTLAYDGKTYEYTFTPVATKDIVISDFNIYKGDVAIDSLEGVAVGDELTVSATIINATGKDEEAVVSYALYGDNYLKAVNLSAGDVTDLTEGVTLYKTFTITEDLGEVDMIKGFLWDSLKTMKPMTGAIELK